MRRLSFDEGDQKWRDRFHKGNYTFIGMSNCGKSYWGELVAKAKGLQWISADKRIEQYLARILQEKGFGGIEGLARWMGFPFEPQYPENSERYLDLERAEYVSVAAAIHSGDPILLDATGSIIHALPKCPDSILDVLREGTTIVLFDTPEIEVEAMIGRFFDHPKPVYWGEYFGFEATGSGVPEEPMDAIRRYYPQLLAARNKLYRKLAHVVVPYEVARDPAMTAERLIEFIESAKA